MKASCAGGAYPHARGFVLVGVVIMVLALTILGLSLFSLSSYEAQFMNRSLDSEQALQYAMGGLARSRFALTVAPESLVKVKRNLPFEYVTYARARQDKGGGVVDSSGLVAANGNNIEITVQAEYRGITRKVMGWYQANAPENYYKRLMTVRDGIEIKDLHFPGPGLPSILCKYTVVLNGRVWETSAALDSSIWTSSAGSYTQGIRTDALPVPAAGGFITAHQSAAIAPTPNGLEYRFWGTPGQVKYWLSEEGGPYFSVYHDVGNYTLSVRGRAVWLLPRGVRFSNMLTVVSNGDPNACLVIVAQQGIDPFGLPPIGVANPSIWFFSGIQSTIPIILVSDKKVLVENFFNILTGVPETLVPNLSIFSSRVFLGGPITLSGHHEYLTYGPAMDAQIDTLMSQSALPNAVSTSPYALVPGTWRVLQ